jgi:anaerobic selenocysteine-containing dehydrogenase
MSITRRNLFQMTGGAAGLLTAPGPFLAFDQFFRPSSAQAATEQKILTACGICSPNCGIEATVRDGALRLLKGIDGDFHGEGHLCGKGAAGAEFLYDPDRLKYPMKRTNRARDSMRIPASCASPGPRPSTPSPRASALTLISSAPSPCCSSRCPATTSGPAS